MDQQAIQRAISGLAIRMSAVHIRMVALTQLIQQTNDPTGVLKTDLAACQRQMTQYQVELAQFQQQATTAHRASLAAMGLLGLVETVPAPVSQPQVGGISGSIRAQSYESERNTGKRKIRKRGASFRRGGQSEAFYVGRREISSGDARGLFVRGESSNTGIDVYTPSIRKESTNRCFQTLNRTTNEQAKSDFSTTEQNSATVTHNSAPQESNEPKKHEENVKNATEGASSHSDSKADTKTDKKSYAAETMKSLSKKKSFSRQKSSWAEEMEEEEAEDGRGKGA
ncbi:uncharacterized protein CTHT_0038210 [Thermochaetoides thermophila DSM 1495]|uniref:Uncharacterized protein n=1 Tax=Chaetomium thermophilum (strain DSM 1495 / CBS 144.50 / IMI 039719) TaxID=759272 RepID=G0S8B1_CHATD|nr:hypothetical protein CTHT_0038210 [Thermochaetoides thermophila DSM 1495]EGS21945.1 hypothetical protein CTHT_0038210 [Thermochaetoides thermophila DSM 1495]